MMNKTMIKKLAGGLCVIAVLALAGFIWRSYELYQEKKIIEQNLQVQMNQQTMMDDQNAALQTGMQTDADIWSVDDEGIITHNGIRYKRNPSIKAILCLGVDSSGALESKAAGSAGQADGLFLVAHNVANDTVRILMIPRDTVTPITFADADGKVTGKRSANITLAYAFGDGRELSCERMQEAVSELLYGLDVPKYMAMNTSMIPTLNDLVGGVTVFVNTDGMENSDPALTKGSEIHLNGAQAEIFVRYRDCNIDNSAMLRMAQQRQYMENYYTALRTEAAKDNTLITRIMDQVQENMITNMNKDEYMKMGMAILANQEALSQQDILTIPGEGNPTNRFDEFHPDQAMMAQVILDLFYRTTD